MDSNLTNEPDNRNVQAGERVDDSAKISSLARLWNGVFAETPLGRLWKWTGIKDKKLWDWIQLLGIPFSLFLLGNSFQTDQNLSKVRDDYLKDMSDNIYNKKIPIPHYGSFYKIPDEIAIATRTRVLSTLQELGTDGNRKGQILGYLYDTQILGGCRISLDDINNNKAVNCQKGYVSIMHEADFSHLQMSGSYLFNINLSGSNLESANFRNAGLNGANFQRANLTDADLSGAYLGKIIQLACATNYKSWLERVINLGSFSCKVNLPVPSNQVSDFSKAIMYHANLEHAILDESKFVNATLRSANFKKAFMKNADLRKSLLIAADLSEADLQGVNLQGVNLQGAKYDSNTLLDFDPMSKGMLLCTKNAGNISKPFGSRQSIEEAE